MKSLYIRLFVFEDYDPRRETPVEKIHQRGHRIFSVESPSLPETGHLLKLAEDFIKDIQRTRIDKRSSK